MIEHVYRRASASPVVAEVIVATDDLRVATRVREFGGKVKLTKATHETGTDRLAEVAASLDCDIVVNVQGDEPLLTPEHIRLLVSPFRERPATQVSTLKIRLAPQEVDNPNVNKVVCGVDGRALYFSKYPIPYDRDGIGVVRFKHPGFYAYRKPALDAFHRLAPSPLELTEKLEQLRFLENGIDIVVVETTEPTIGVDTEADLQAVAALMAERGRAAR